MAELASVVTFKPREDLIVREQGGPSLGDVVSPRCAGTWFGSMPHTLGWARAIVTCRETLPKEAVVMKESLEGSVHRIPAGHSEPDPCKSSPFIGAAGVSISPTDPTENPGHRAAARSLNAHGPRR